MIHLNIARAMLDSTEPVDLTIVTAKGEVQNYKNCIGLKYNHYSGCRNVKLKDSGEIRKVRECLIIGINGQEVFI